METLTIKEILRSYKTDKVSGTPAGGDGHCYGEMYHTIFSQFDRNEAISIFEIGTQKGGSLCAWRDYFPNAKIKGIDIVDVVLNEYKRNDITYIIDDIKNYKSDETYDIVIDDGSHYLHDVEFVLKEYLPKLNVGGVLIIEDVQNLPDWVQALRKYANSLYKMDTFDMRRKHGNYDDCAIVFRH